jgi:hypothetical protein
MPSLPTSVITDNLWIDLRPTDISGTSVIDQSGNGRNGVLYNGAVVTQTPTGEDAFYTDGVNDSMQYRITSASQKPSTGFPFTTECWLYRYDSSSSPFMYAIFGHPTNSRFRIFDSILYQTTAQTVTNGNAFQTRFYTNKTTDSDNTFRNESLLDNRIITQAQVSTSNNTWYHIVNVFYKDASDRLHRKVYIDGVFIRDDYQTTNFPYYLTDAAWPWEGYVSSVDHMEWGFGLLDRYSSGVYPREGYGGDFRMYTDELTSAEVLNNYNATKSRYGK